MVFSLTDGISSLPANKHIIITVNSRITDAFCYFGLIAPLQRWKLSDIFFLIGWYFVFWRRQMNDFSSLNRQLSSIIFKVYGEQEMQN